MFKIMSAMVALLKEGDRLGMKVFGKLQCFFRSASDPEDQMDLMTKLEDASEVWKLML